MGIASKEEEAINTNKENDMKEAILVVFAIIIVLALLAVIPWVSFWAIATLFGYTIQLTWTTGLAYWVLVLLTFGGKVQVSK